MTLDAPKNSACACQGALVSAEAKGEAVRAASGGIGHNIDSQSSGRAGDSKSHLVCVGLLPARRCRNHSGRARRFAPDQGGRH